MTSASVNWTRYSLDVLLGDWDGQLVQIGFQTLSGNSEPAGVFYDNVELKKVTENAVGSIATNSPLAIADTMAGGVNTGTVTVSNTGTGDLTVTSIETTDPLAPLFSVAFDSCSFMTLSPLADCAIIVQFMPGTDGMFMNSFDIVSDDPVSSPITVSVSATALSPQVPLLSAIANPPDLPETMVTETSTGTITIANVGDADLIVNAINGLIAPFSVMSETCTSVTVAPIGTCTATIEFAPAADGPFNGSLMIDSNDTSSPAAVAVSGTGTMLVVPDTDEDTFDDSVDNCILVANPDQRDTNGDGYGNACVPDLDNNGVVNFADIGLWAPFFNTETTGDADFNGDGLANFADYAIFPDYFLQSPGPSGIAP